jgi:hypothetical protein
MGAALREQGHQVRLVPAVHQTLPKVQQKRLPGCRSDRRSGDQREHTVCADQAPGAAGCASHASGSRSSGATAHGTHQRDPGNLAGTRHHLCGPTDPSPQEPACRRGRCGAELECAPALAAEAHVAGVEAGRARHQSDDGGDRAHQPGE